MNQSVFRHEMSFTGFVAHVYFLVLVVLGVLMSNCETQRSLKRSLSREISV